MLECVLQQYRYSVDALRHSATKKWLDLSSGVFLQQYTVPFDMDKDGMPGVNLKPVEGGIACQFMKPKGYGVRRPPDACRYYPVALLTIRPALAHFQSVIFYGKLRRRSLLRLRDESKF